MKRAIELIISGIGIICLMPVFFILIILTSLDVGKPFFRQKRIGFGEKVFYLIKFKTMKDIDIQKGMISNEDRVTKFGRFVRNYSIDELPGLFNIFKGDMSFVGPRPLLVEYLPFYKERHKKRHLVKPGLTGLAQINGRNNTTWNERLDYDIQYVENQSFALDLKILLSTVVKVFKKEGVESTVDLSIVRLDKDLRYKNQK